MLIAVDAFFDTLHAGAARRIRRVGRELETDEAPGAPDEIEHLGQPAHERGEFRGVETGDLAPLRGELVGAGVGRVEQLVDARIAGIGQQSAEIPDDIGGGQVGIGVGRSHEA